MPTPLFRGADHAPASSVAVVSGDYKSVDPTAVVLEVGGPEAEVVALRVVLDVTAASGGGGVTVNIEGFNEGSNDWYPLLVSALVTATGKVQLVVDPRKAAAANLVAQEPLPPTVRIRPVGSGTRTTLNYSVTAVVSN